MTPVSTLVSELPGDGAVDVPTQRLVRSVVAEHAAGVGGVEREDARGRLGGAGAGTRVPLTGRRSLRQQRVTAGAEDPRGCSVGIVDADERDGHQRLPTLDADVVDGDGHVA